MNGLQIQRHIFHLCYYYWNILKPPSGCLINEIRSTTYFPRRTFLSVGIGDNVCWLNFIWKKKYVGVEHFLITLKIYFPLKWKQMMYPQTWIINCEVSLGQYLELNSHCDWFKIGKRFFSAYFHSSKFSSIIYRWEPMGLTVDVVGILKFCSCLDNPKD